MNEIKIVWKLAYMELMRLVRSSKVIILALFVIFINIQIIAPLRELSNLMGHKLSVFEPFAAIGNSGVVVLILPLFFITMMADFPREGECQYFYRIRCSKRIWIVGQIVYAIESAVTLTFFVLVASILLSLDFISWKSDYSYAVTRYVAVFPEHSGQSIYSYFVIGCSDSYSVDACIIFYYARHVYSCFFNYKKENCRNFGKWMPYYFWRSRMCRQNDLYVGIAYGSYDYMAALCGISE